MKKTIQPKPLLVSVEKLRALTEDQLRGALGAYKPCPNTRPGASFECTDYC